MKVINPSLGEVIREIEEDNENSIREKYLLARQVQPMWRKKSLEERIECLERFWELLDIHKETLAKNLHEEVGKPLPEAINEISGARYRIRFFLENVSEWLTEDEVHEVDNTREIISYDPLGVVCNISAWNYPLLVGVNVFVPALIAGNAVLYKPSEYSSLTGLLMEKYLLEAGLPEGVFTSIIGGPQTGEVLLNLECDGYFFTGSYKTGKYIAEKVAPRLVPVGLELGGKDPVYVTDDVDLKKVAAAVAEGCFYNDGQSCCAVERVYVHEKVYASFIESFLEEAEKFPVGPVTRKEHIAFLEEQIRDAVVRGAKILTGGKRSGNGNHFPPTILVDVNHEMSLMKDETFGPVIGVMKVQNDEEATQLMNDSEFGLTASVYSRDIERARLILKKLDTGTAYINCCDRVSPYLPWSGRKHSGSGSTLSYLGILAFAKPRGWHIRY